MAKTKSQQLIDYWQTRALLAEAKFEKLQKSLADILIGSIQKDEEDGQNKEEAK